MVQFLRQAPVVFASRYTTASLVECGQLFSFSMLALPWAFCAVCWFVLPSNRKTWVAFPILATLTGWMATSVHAVGEAAIATSYEWLILLVVLFRAKSTGWMLLWVLLLAPAFRLHEGTFPFLTVIAISAAFAIRDARSWPARTLLGFGTLILVCTIADQLYWVVHPQFPRDRDAITEGLLNGEFIYYDGHFNLQLINGAVALLVIVLLGLVEVFLAGKPLRVVQATLIFWALSCVSSVLCASMVEQSFAPFAHLQARYNPPLVSAILALAILVLIRRALPDRFLASPSLLVVIVTLSLIQSVADIAATQRWNAFVTDLQFRLSNSRGLIPWETTIRTNDTQADKDWRLVKIGWVVPYFSIVYAPNGVVTAIIDCPKETIQCPLNPAQIDRFPRLNSIDYSPYRKFLLEQEKNRG